MKLLVPASLSLLVSCTCVWLALDATAAPAPPSGANQPPVCCFEPTCQPGGLLKTVVCAGPETTVVLDATGSYDPEGRPLTYFWQSCPGSTIDDPTAPITTLRIDTSLSCVKFCGVRLTVGDGVNISMCRMFIEVVEAPEGPDLDVKPGSCPNPVNVGATGLLPVALVGTTGFDVTQVDLSTLELVRSDGVGGAVAPIQHAFEDAATPFTGRLCECHTLTADGILDLSLKFDKQTVVATLQLGSEPDMSFLEVTLKGKLLDGTDFEASDCIRVQGTGI